MRRLFSLGLAAFLMASCSCASAVARDGRLARVHTWAFAIGGDDLSGNLAARYGRYDLVVLDGEGATRSQVVSLRRKGKVVLGYLDVGTIEPFRSWYPLLKPYRLAYWPDWGEWYANVDEQGYRRAIERRIAPTLLRKRFDGLFLDNTDMVESYPGQARGMRSLVGQLATIVHRGRAGLLFTQNGEASIARLLRYYDGWNREDVTGTYDFGTGRYVVQPPDEIASAQRALRSIARHGLLVLATDYTAAGDSRTAVRAVADACAAGALPFVSDIGLSRIPAAPPRCPR